MNSLPHARRGSMNAMLVSRLDDELSTNSSVSIIEVVELLIAQAHATGASDIHIDPSREYLRTRLRIDGVLVDYRQLPKNIQHEIISRIKILSALRTDEHQMPQDGRFRYELPDGAFIDMRVSIAPTYYGENVVLRLLTNNHEEFTLSRLGFNQSDIRRIEQALKKQNGMILATGPTGSGKTTTLYTLLKSLNTPDVSIITIEDPIEYSVDSIEQIQVNARTGLTFATGLRSILRQDPDIIMVGEIRDAETANIAVNTALTGHLLLSTLHTNDAATTLPRLTDMGIDPYLVASTITIAIGQRLVRRICESCAETISVTPALAESLAHLDIHPGEPFRRTIGCDACGGTGYVGRLSINEVLVADADIQEAILRKASPVELRRIAVANGMTTMITDALTKARAGETSLKEMLRVIHD